MNRTTIATALTIATLLGCSGSPSNQDAGPADSGSNCTPTAAGACTPNACSTGNALNVGAYCTKGMNQCAGYPNGAALSCAIDLSTDGANFCILLGCHANADCGTGACCTGDPTQSPILACVPSGCLVSDGGACPPPPTRGTDAGSTDGGDGG